jgi:PTS system mannose-specific IID component
VKFTTLTNIALRSLLLEASWNNQGQQNLGLAAAIDPGLKLIYGPGEALKSARERAVGFFNTNPILSGLAIGVTLKLEEDVAAARISAGDRVRMSAGLNRALAALGDALFWQSWLPFCGLAAVWAVLSLGYWWTPLILPALFCLPAVPLRLGGLYLGYRRGEKVVDLLFRIKAQRLSLWLRRGVALLTGVSTVILIFTKAPVERTFSRGGLWATLALITAGVVCLRLTTRRAQAISFWYPLLLMAGACAFLICLDAFAD